MSTFFYDDDLEQFDIIYINGYLKFLHQTCNCQYNLFTIIIPSWKY
jgi:hypothetical protein